MNTIHNNSNSPERKIKGDVFSLYCRFKMRGIVCSVENPEFRMKHYDSDSYSQIRCLGTSPTQKDLTAWRLRTVDEGNTYQIEIDPIGLELGWYQIFFIGDYSDGTETKKIVLKDSIEIAALSRRDRILNSALNAMGDKDPEAYFDWTGKFHRFSKGSLMTFLEDGIGWINAQPPQSNNYTMETLPTQFDTFLKKYIFSSAMLEKARLAIDNDLKTSDSHAVSTDYYDKYLRLYEKEIDLLRTQVIDFKKTRPPQGRLRVRERLPGFVVYYGLAYGSRSFFADTAMSYRP